MKSQHLHEEKNDLSARVATIK